MSRRLVSERTKEKYKKSVNKLIESLSRSVVVYKQSIKNECDNCYFDNLTNKSTGKCKWTPQEALSKQSAWLALGNSTVKYKYFLKGRCPVCSGIGYLETLRRTSVKCIINWAPSADDILQLPAGLAGATPVLLKTYPSYMELFKNCERVVVDGIECTLSTPPMLRGLGNESVLFVLAFTSKTITEIKSTEVIKGYYG